MMRTAPEGEALDILFRLRASGDPQSVLESSRGSTSGQYQPSAYKTARAVSPQTFSMLEFDASTRQPMPYRLETQVSTAAIALGSIPSLGSSETSSSLSFGTPQHQLQRQGDLCDQRLRQLDISYWTAVPIPSSVAAKAISTCLQANHPIWELCDADLFIRDLVGKRVEFCSPFLVNALLCYACLYGVTGPGLPEMSIPFAQATEALWRAERTTDTAINVAAILMYSLCCTPRNSPCPRPS